MKILSRIFFGILSMCITVAMIGFFQPQRTDVEVSLDIDKSDENVFLAINDLKKWEQWSPWKAFLPFQFSPVTFGKGAYCSWKNLNDVGSLKITNVIKYNELDFDTYFGTSTEPVQNSIFINATKKDECRVKWMLSFEVGFNPFARFAMIFMKSDIEKVYKQGLFGLKGFVEHGF